MGKWVDMRYRWIDIARGLAMLMVIVGHVSGPITEFAGGQNFLFMGNIPVFFFLSGLLFRPKRFLDRLKTNFNTLLLLYITFALLVLVYIVWAVKFHGAGWSIKATILGSFWAVGDNGSMPAGMMSLGAVWFFVALGLATVLFGSVVAWAQRVSRRYQTLTTIAMSVGLFVIGMIIPAQAPWSLKAVFMSQLFLLLGYLGQNWVKTNWSLARISLIGLVSLVIWGWASRYGTFYLVSGTFTGPAVVMLVGAVASVFAILAVAQFIDQYLWQIGNSFAWIGQYSAVVLFVHAFSILILGKIVFGPTVGMWLTTYNPLIAWGLMVLTNVGIIIIVVQLMLGVPFINKIFMDRQWPFALRSDKSGTIKSK